MFKKKFLLKMLTFLFRLLIFNIVEVKARRVKVRGYYRKDGTYVRPHYRTTPERTLAFVLKFTNR
jgi:hypothetical protein